MNFVDRVLIALGEQSVRTDLFNTNALEACLNAVYDLSAIAVQAPFNAVFDNVEVGITLLAGNRGSAKIYGQGNVQFDAQFELQQCYRDSVIIADAHWRGSIIARSVPDNAIIKTVTSQWLNFSEVDARIIVVEGTLPTEPAALETARTNALITLLQKQSQSPDAVNATTVESIKHYFSVTSLSELLQLNTGGQGNFKRFSDAPQSVPQPVAFPIRAMILISNEAFSLRVQLIKTAEAASPFIIVNIDTSALQPVAQRSPGVIAIVTYGFIFLQEDKTMNLNHTRIKRAVPLLMLAPLLSTLPACWRAPTLEGSNQVYDPNVEATILKDNGLAWQTWNEVDTYMENLIGNPQGPGCAVGIARGGELTYLQGYGKAKIGGENWSVGTVGAVGSVSKTFTAAAMLRMDELGLLDAINDSVDSYLPTSNSTLGSKQFYRLLSNSSGVGGAAFSPNWDYSAADCVGVNSAACQAVNKLLAQPAWAYSQYHEDEPVASLANNNPVFGDPHQGVYSNVGFSVAGAVIDKVAENTDSGGYEAWMWDNIGQHTGNLLSGDNLLSLALTHSWRANDIPHRAVGYTPGGGGFSVKEAWQATGGLEGWQGPSGGWAMTIGDLTRFALALHTQQIVGGVMLNSMRFHWTDLDGFNDLVDDYGMGMFLGVNINQPDYWHGGLIGGHTSVWAWWDTYPFGQYTDQSLAVSVICNRDDVMSTATSMRDTAADIAFAARYTAPQPLQYEVAFLDDTRRLDGTVFELDHRSAWQTWPNGAFVPLTLLSHTLFVHVEEGERGLVLQLSEGEVRNGQFIPTGPPQVLGPADFSQNPWFSTRPAAVRLATEAGEVEITDFAIKGAFDDRGAALTGVVMNGKLDTRQAETLAGKGSGSICADLADAGAKCEPCDDGVEACLTVSYEGLAGAIQNLIFMDRFEG